MGAEPEELRRRLGRYAIGTSRELDALAEMASGEQVLAAVVAVRDRRGWVALATDRGLRLARRPRVFGRSRSAAFEWRDLSGVRSGPQRVDLQFGPETVKLIATQPHDEFVRLVEAARAHGAGGAKPSVEELRELAHTKLGKLVTFGWEAAIDGLPDRLEEGERVERLAAATLGFYGLLVLTDRRLLLLDVALRSAREQLWEVPRSEIADAELDGPGLRLLLSDDREVTLTEFVPPARRDEFAAVLAARE